MKIWGSCCCVVLFMALGVPALAAPAEKPKPGVETEKPSKLVVRHEGRDVVANVEDILLMSDDVGWRLADGAEIEEVLQGAQEIPEREYLEERQARRWLELREDLELRNIDRRALELVKEFESAKQAVPPSRGDAGTVVFAFGSYTPKILCRPMRVTDVILEPGEVVTGVFPGDTARWTFVPGRSGSGENERLHVMIKPLMADISTNLVVTTDRRTYNVDLVSVAERFMASVSFTYPADTLKAWDEFVARRRTECAALPEGTVSPESLHFDYEIRGKNTIRWKPVHVWDDGVKTYIRFPAGSTLWSIEAPVLVLYERKKEMLVNYRVVQDMYVVDKVFDKAGLIAGTGAHQSRIVIVRRPRR